MTINYQNSADAELFYPLVKTNNIKSDNHAVQSADKLSLYEKNTKMISRKLSVTESFLFDCNSNIKVHLREDTSKKQKSLCF